MAGVDADARVDHLDAQRAFVEGRPDDDVLAQVAAVGVLDHVRARLVDRELQLGHVVVTEALPNSLRGRLAERERSIA